MLRKSILVVLTLFVLLQAAATASVNTQAQQTTDDKGITISPVRFQFDVEPGEVVTGTIKLINDTFSDKEIFLYSRNFISDGQSGTPLFTDDFSPFTASLSDWIALEKDAVTVQKVESDDPHVERINFEIHVPEDAEPGGHYAGILATLVKPGESILESSNDDKGQLAFKDERAAIILLNVAGDVNRTLVADKFYATDAFSKEKPLIRIFEWMPVGFFAEIRNIGNSHTVPLGHVLLFSGDSKIDDIDFNPTEGNILRESSRNFFDVWKGALLELVPVLDENGDEVVDSNGNVQSRFSFNLSNLRLPLGKFTAKLAVGYDDGGDKKTLIDQFDFWVIPWKLLLLLLILLAAYVYYRIKKSKTKKADHRK